MERQNDHEEPNNAEHVEILVEQRNNDRHSNNEQCSPNLRKSSVQVPNSEKTVPSSQYTLSFAQPFPTKPSLLYSQGNATTDYSIAPSSSVSSLAQSSLTPTLPHSSSFDPSSITLEQKRDLLVSLGQALLRYGTPSYRVENGLKLTAAKLNLKMTFTFTPESLMMTAVKRPSTTGTSTNPTIKNQRHRRHHRYHRNLLRNSTDMRRRKDHNTHSNTDLVSATSERSHQPNKNTAAEQQPWIILLKIKIAYDNAKLARISRLMHRFYTDDPTLTFVDCLSQLKYDIIAAPATCGPWTRIFASTVTAFAASIIMFKGSWLDSGFSALLGMVVGALKELANQTPLYARVFEVSTCTMISVAVRALHRYCCFNATILSSIIILLPGYAMTMAVMEITSKHMVSGAIRLIHVIVYSFLLAYGLELGSYLYGAIHPDVGNEGYCPTNTAAAVPPNWVIIPLFPIMTCGLSMTFGSAPRQWPSEIISAALGFGATWFMRRIIPDPPILNAISAFLVGLYSHIMIKLTKQPPISPISIGISMLVPGSIGVKGAFTSIHQREQVKSNFALQMLNIAIGLSVGLFASGMVVSPIGKRRSLYISL